MNIQDEMDRIFKMQKDNLDNERKFKNLGQDFNKFDVEAVSFQDDFYNLLEKYGVDSIDIEHPEFNTICNLRNKVFEFIENEVAKWVILHNKKKR